MKKIIFLVLFVLSTHLYATPNSFLFSSANYDDNHKLIPPDQYYLARGAKAYLDGYNQTALINFRKSASFGNTQAQFLIGLMHIKSLGVQQNWAKGYAWIKLAALDKSKKHSEYSQAVFDKLTPEEKNQTAIEYKTLLKEYNPSKALWRRDRWVKMQRKKTAGSHTGFIGNVTSYYTIQDLQRGAGGDPNTAERFAKEFNAFVNDYNFGYVSSGEIVPKEDESKAKEK